MFFKDFRDYLDNLEKNGLLLRVKKEIDPKYEIAAGIRKISDTNGPALLFENVKGYPGWRVVGGLFGTQKLMAYALQCEDDEKKLLERHLDFYQNPKYIKPVVVPTGPVKEVIIKGDDIDLTKLPAPTYCEYDVGPYLTAGIDIGKHPVTGTQNCSIMRRMIIGKDKTSILSQTPGMKDMISAAEAQGKGLGIATVLGPHPAATIASQIQAPLGIDEMEIAGAIRGKPIEVVKCETIDVNVPSDAEMVIEGVTIPGERVADGPFGEYPGNYVSLTNYHSSAGKSIYNCPLIKVTAITMRKNAIFHAMLTGMPMTENHWLYRWSITANIHQTVLQSLPHPDDLRGVYLTHAGMGHYHLVIGVKKRTESTARNIIYPIMSRHWGVGLVTVVDEDINIYDSEQVEWAVSSRVRPDRDVIIIQPVQPAPESVSNVPIYEYKWGIDATAPMTKEPYLYKRAVPPGVDKVDYV